MLTADKIGDADKYKFCGKGIGTDDNSCKLINKNVKNWR